MHTESTGITVHAFIRPDTPAAAGRDVVAKICELYDFGVISSASAVWCNLDLPHLLWVLSDRSTLLRIVDVPTAGWVRLTHDSAVWGRVAADTLRSPMRVAALTDIPMPRQPHDTVTVALRNADSALMRAQFGGQTHLMENFEIGHGQIRVIDLKTATGQHKLLRSPSDYDRHHAHVRGVDLMAATAGPPMHKLIRENMNAFTSVIASAEFSRVNAAQQRIQQIAEVITDPILQRISELDAVRPFAADADYVDTLIR